MRIFKSKRPCKLTHWVNALWRVESITLILAGAFAALIATPVFCEIPSPYESAYHEAKSLFTRYQALEALFDSRITELYADTAEIQQIEINGRGEAEVTHIPTARYLDRLKSQMAKAKTLDDRGKYSDIHYKTVAGDTVNPQSVEIQAIRQSYQDGSKGKLTLIVGPDKALPNSEPWKIYAERFEVRSP